VQTVYIRERGAEQVARPCEWYEDVETARGMLYCRAPAMWLVIAAVGAGTLFMMARKR
jgi:hypothetical protein